MNECQCAECEIHQAVWAELARKTGEAIDRRILGDPDAPDPALVSYVQDHDEIDQDHSARMIRLFRLSHLQDHD